MSQDTFLRWKELDGGRRKPSFSRVPLGDSGEEWAAELGVLSLGAPEESTDTPKPHHPKCLFRNVSAQR